MSRQPRRHPRRPPGRALRPIALALLLGLVCPLPAACSGDAAAPRHGVLLITLDTTRADHLSAYGHGRETSPTMDRLAAEGVRFELCISTSAVTPVSHASILTGLNPYSHGLRVLAAESGTRLPDDVPTLATVLAERGWRTGAFLSSFPVSEHFGLDQGFDPADYDNGLGTPAEGQLQDHGDGQHGWDTIGSQRRSDRTTDRALEWLADVDEPFFLWIHYWDPHDPTEIPPVEEVRRFLPEFQKVSSLDPRLYDAEIHWVDTQIGRLVEALRAAGRLDETLIAITSDHGEGMGDHDWQFHRILYQEQIHLPLILRGPGARGGGVVPDLVRSIDLFPTVLELVGVDAPGALDGRSLVPLIAGRADEPRLAYADQLNLWDANARMLEKRPDAALLHVMMDRRWKLIWHNDEPGKSELYDLESDPREARNLFAPDHPEVVRLKAELDRRDPWVTESFGAFDETSRAADALRELGYVDGAEDGPAEGGDG